MLRRGRIEMHGVEKEGCCISSMPATGVHLVHFVGGGGKRYVRWLGSHQLHHIDYSCQNSDYWPLHQETLQ